MPGLKGIVERVSWQDCGIDEKREWAAAKKAKPMRVLRGRKGSEAFIVGGDLGKRTCGAHCELHQIPRGGDNGISVLWIYQLIGHLLQLHKSKVSARDW